MFSHTPTRPTGPGRSSVPPAYLRARLPAKRMQMCRRAPPCGVRASARAVLPVRRRPLPRGGALVAIGRQPPAAEATAARRGSRRRAARVCQQQPALFCQECRSRVLLHSRARGACPSAGRPVRSEGGWRRGAACAVRRGQGGGFATLERESALQAAPARRPPAGRRSAARARARRHACALPTHRGDRVGRARAWAPERPHARRSGGGRGKSARSAV